MSYSFSADAVQYGRDSAYYVRDITDGGTSVIPGNLDVTGDLTVEGASELTGNVATAGNLAVGNGTSGGVVNIGAGNTVLTPSGTGGLTVSTALPGATATMTLAGSLAVGNGAIGGVVNLGAGNTVLTPSGAGGLTVSTTLPGATASVSVAGNLDIGNSIVGGVLNIGAGNSIFTPSGAGNLTLSTSFPGTTATMLIPQIANGSLFSVPSVPVAVEGSSSGLPAGTFVIAGVRVMWGLVNNGASPGINFEPAFGAVPCIIATPIQFGTTNGYATVGDGTSTTGSSLALTTSAGTGFTTACFWLAIGKA